MPQLPAPPTLAIALLLAGFLIPAHGIASEPTFERDIRPILKAHCFHCHGEDGTLEAGIDLRQVRLMQQSGALNTNNLAASAIIEQVTSGAMPKHAKPLPPHDVARILEWVTAGAHTARPEPDTVPNHFVTEEERAHWAFQTVVRPAVPANQEPHPIDAFVRRQLDTASLDFAPQADRVTLLRRASFDLLGLPPTAEETAAFLADDQPQAWSRVIDRLLASPHYGERWGRHWLDVVGYADSNGGPHDKARAHSWHYRDYVIRALNHNQPWHSFLQEQLAGDELARLTAETAPQVLADPAQWDRLAATGFWQMAPDATGDSPPDPVVARESVIVDNLKVFGSAVLGLTLGCAQCHDHRFDPMSHVDYYRLRAMIEPTFNPTDWRTPYQRHFMAYTPAEREQNEHIEARAALIDQQRTELIDREYNKYLEERIQHISAEIQVELRRAWNTPASKRTEADTALLKTHDITFEKVDHLRFLANREKEEAQRSQWVKDAKAIRETKLTRVLMIAHERRGVVPPTRRFHRGDYRQPKEEIAPGDLALFEQAPSIPLADPEQFSSGRRLAYARWLTSGQHPLVARVLVNRFWFHHFGKGLSMPLADFGLRTPRPLYGDLLDWLASEFVDHGWDLKHWHRLVMSSRTYQQSTRNPAAEATDAENSQLARSSLKRLEAEAVRDALLAVCGNLNRQLGGAPVSVARHPAGGVVLGEELTNDNNNVVHTVLPVGDQAHRRSVYVQAIRNRPLTVLQAFDLPMMLPNCNQRAVTTVAPQSLMMLNDSFVVEQSRIFATRLIHDHGTDRAALARTLWLRAYSIAPTDDELTASLALIEQESARQWARSIPSDQAIERAVAALCQVVFASNRFLYAP